MVLAALFLLSKEAFELIIIVVCMLSAWEWSQLVGFTTKIQRIWLAILFGVLILLMKYALPLHKPLIATIQVHLFLLATILWWLVALLLVIHYPNSSLLLRYSILLRLFYGAFTIIPFFWCTLILREYNYELNHYTGSWCLLYVFILTWGVDSGAFFVGRFIGNHKLAPKISPDKTYEGMVGGLITSAIIASCLGQYVPLDTPLIMLLIKSIVAAVASVLGDLTESMFKREAGIKDSGYLIPGHGGILDRIDSLTAAVPIFTYLIFLI